MELSFPSCVRGHHIYKRTWTPTIGDVLTCERETGNTEDRYAVAVLRLRLRYWPCTYKILATFALAELKLADLSYIRQSAKLNSPPIFHAIRYVPRQPESQEAQGEPP